MHHRYPFLLLLVVALLPGVDARERAPLKPEDLVLIQKGTIPIIVSAPHGGRQKVPDVPERRGKGLTNFYTLIDRKTFELSEQFAEDLGRSLKGKPWLVLARFDRLYIDANRPADEAYESDRARPVYDAYHGALASACKAVKSKHGRGLLLDIHGQGEFRDSICRGTKNGKSVTVLKERSGWPAITGKRSVLGYLQDAGYSVRPSCTAGEKAKEEPKFDGGHIVSTYGSHTGYAIDAIQLEFGSQLRDSTRYEKTSRDLAAAVAQFHNEYLVDK